MENRLRSFELRTFAKIIWTLFAFVTLTVLTQTGGLVYLIWKGISIILSNHLEKVKTLSVLGFPLLYLLSSFIVIPLVAPFFGRVSLPITEQNGVKPASVITCLLNRHYVNPQLAELIFRTSETLSQEIPNVQVIYLDANFPFIDGFPLLPHWSHSDGKKLDLGFVYTDMEGNLINDLPTHFGYGSFNSPKPNEFDAAAHCLKKGAYQYGFLEYFAWFPTHYELDVKSTARLIEILLKENQVQKIFIEPHLKERWGLSEYNKIRFHGCHAVRHDDHIHFQIN